MEYTSALIFGGIFAQLSLWASKFILVRQPTLGMKRRLLPKDGRISRGKVAQIEAAISSPFNRYVFRALAPILVAFLVVLAATAFSQPLNPFGILAYLGSLGVGYPFLLHFPLTDHRRRLAVLCSRLLVRHTRPEVSEEVMARIVHSSSPVVRLAAIQGLRELGTPAGIEMLRRLSDDPHHKVAADARNAVSDLLPVMTGTQVLSVRTMETYVREHEYWGTHTTSTTWIDDPKPADQLAEITLQIEDIVFSQLPIRRAFPDVYCMDCYARAEAMRHGEWEWIRCKRCQEVHGLRIGVKKAVGQIGGVDTPRLEAGILYLPVWNEAEHQARYAELDELQVIGGKAIHYDWAVGSLVQKIHDQHIGPAYTTTVRLIGQPTLETNSLQLLRSLDPSATSS